MNMAVVAGQNKTVSGHKIFIVIIYQFLVTTALTLLCVAGCPTGAMHKREEDGLVVVNQDVCVGCRYCELRCPYGAPQFDEKEKIDVKM